jgi:hypothetical protein
MAAYTSSQTGNWSSAATWGGGGVPGDGDTAAIGAHTVTVDADTTVGDSPASLGMVVTVADSGALTVGTGITLTVKGGIQCNSAPLTLNAGANIVVVAGTGVNYRIQPGVSGDPLGALYCNGTSGARCSITKTGAGTAEIYQYMSTSGGEFKCTYTDFSNLGSTGTTYAIKVRRDFQLSYCTFDSCGIIDGYGSTIDADKNLSISNCTFKNSIGNFVMDVRCTTTPDAGKVRTISSNSFDISLNIGDMRGGTVTGNYFAVQPTLPSATYRPDTWQNNFVVTGAGLETPVTTIDGDYRYNAATDNGHLGILSDKSQTWTNCIFESGIDWSTNEHDGIIISTSPTSARTYTITNNITLPSPSRLSSCTLFTIAVDANVAFQVERNTIYAGDRGHGFVGVHWDGAAGFVTYFQNNVGWCDSGDTTARLLADDPAISLAANYITSCDYNLGYGLSANYDVDSGAFAASPGTHDLASTVNPRFVDPTRCLPAWAETVLGASGTDSELRAAALAALATMNDPTGSGYVSGVTVAGLVSWVRAGFAPRNAALSTAGDDGSYIGALSPVSSKIDRTVNSSDVSVTTVTTHSVSQASITGTADFTSGMWRNAVVKAKEDNVAQNTDGTADGTTDTDASLAESYTRLRIGCTGTGATQQPLGLIRNVKLLKDVL